MFLHAGKGTWWALPLASWCPLAALLVHVRLSLSTARMGVLLLLSTTLDPSPAGVHGVVILHGGLCLSTFS